MAAHKLTGVREVVQWCKDGASYQLENFIEPSLKIDCWTTDDIAQPSETNIWYILNAFANGDITVPELQALLEAQLPRIEREWAQLGRPDTREEWYKAKYGSKP